ncbi:MAG: hypothetical protein ABFS43_19750 [Thermodesulfobacteriota bacterium]
MFKEPGRKWIYLVTVLLLFHHVCAYAGKQLSLEWDPVNDPDIYGYRLFSRMGGEEYDYNNPDWQGEDTNCSIFIDDGEATYFFVVRAFNLEGIESSNSNEVKYPDNVSRSLSTVSAESHEVGCFIAGLS